MCFSWEGNDRGGWSHLRLTLKIRQSMTVAPLLSSSIPTPSFAHMPRNLAVLFLPCGSRAGTSPLPCLVSVSLRAAQTEEAPRGGGFALSLKSAFKTSTGSPMLLPDRPLQGHLTLPLCHRTFSLSRKRQRTKGLLAERGVKSTFLHWRLIMLSYFVHV